MHIKIQNLRDSAHPDDRVLPLRPLLLLLFVVVPFPIVLDQCAICRVLCQCFGNVWESVVMVSDLSGMYHRCQLSVACQ